MIDTTSTAASGREPSSPATGPGVPAVSPRTATAGAPTFKSVEIGGGRFGDYLVVLDKTAIDSATATGLTTWWPAEIRELQRLQSESPEMIEPAVWAKIAMRGTEAEARLRGPDEAVEARGGCAHAKDEVVEEWACLRPSTCARCWLDGAPLREAA